MLSPRTPLKSSFLVLFASGILFAADGVEPVTNVLHKSGQLIDAGQYPEAAALLEQHRSEAERQGDERSEGLILNQLGIVYQRQGKFLASRSALDGSIAHLTRAEGGDTLDLIHPLNSLANLLYECDQATQAETVVHRSLKILNGAGPPDENMGIELALLAKIRLAEGKIPLARQSAERSLEILTRYGHAEDLSASIPWTVLGSIYADQKDNAVAEDSLQHALSMMRAQLDSRDYRVGEALANLGLLYANQGSRDRAEPLLEEARASFRAQQTNTVFVRDFLAVWANIERKTGHSEKAKELTKEAKTLNAGRSEASTSRYVVDANAFR